MIISNSQGVWLGFSLRSTPQHLWVMWVYIVWVQKVCISTVQTGKTKCLAGVSQEGLTCKILTRHSYLHPVLTPRIPVMCKAHASLHKKLSREIPMRTLLASIA